MEHQINLPKVNSTYRFRGRDYLVAYSSGDKIRLEDFNSHASKVLNPKQFNDQIVRGELRLVAESCLPIDFQVFKSLNPNQANRRDRRAHYVKYFQTEFDGVLVRADFDKNILLAAQQIDDPSPPCYSSVAAWMRRYINSNNAPTSLMDAHMYITRRTNRIPDQVHHIIKRSIDNVFLKEEAPSESHVYELVKAEVFRFNKDFNVGEILKMPSRKAVRARIDDIDPMQRIERRAGKYMMHRRNRRGGRLFVEDHIGTRCEMDSQFADVMVVSPHYEVPMRPYLTLVLDVATRCVLGWEFSFLSPSAAKSMKALREAVTHDPFVATRAVPHKLIVDNGCEFANDALKSSCEYAGMTLTFCSPGKGDQKAHVERLFGTFNTRFFHNLRGTTKSSPIARGDYDSEGAALFTIDELKESFSKYISTVYHLTKHSELGMSPLAKWNQLAAIRPARTMESSASKGLFLIPRAVSINRGRVRAFGLEWRGPGLPSLAENLSRSRTKQKVILEINPDAIGEAFVIDPTRKMPAQLVQCTLDSKYHQMSLAQVKAITMMMKEEGRRFDVLNEETLARGILELHELINKKASENKSKRFKKSIVRKNLHEIEQFIDQTDVQTSREDLSPEPSTTESALLSSLPGPSFETKEHASVEDAPLSNRDRNRRAKAVAKHVIDDSEVSVSSPSKDQSLETASLPDQAKLKSLSISQPRNGELPTIQLPRG
jgi:putative transposase